MNKYRRCENKLHTLAAESNDKTIKLIIDGWHWSFASLRLPPAAEDHLIETEPERLVQLAEQAKADGVKTMSESMDWLKRRFT